MRMYTQTVRMYLIEKQFFCVSLVLSLESNYEIHPCFSIYAFGHKTFFKEVETRKGGVIDLDVFHKSEQVKEDNIYGQSREVRLPNTIAHFCSRTVYLECHGFNKT